MKNILLSIIKAIAKTGLTLCIVPLVMIGMLLLSLVRLVFCLAVLIFKPRRLPPIFKNGLPVS